MAYTGLTMTKSFTFELGNAPLSEHEEVLVEQVNEAFVASARKHNVRLKPDALLSVKSFPLKGKLVRRAVRGDHEPVDVPLATPWRAS